MCPFPLLWSQPVAQDEAHNKSSKHASSGQSQLASQGPCLPVFVPGAVDLEGNGPQPQCSLTAPAGGGQGVDKVGTEQNTCHQTLFEVECRSAFFWQSPPESAFCLRHFCSVRQESFLMSWQATSLKSHRSHFSRTLQLCKESSASDVSSATWRQ